MDSFAIIVTAHNMETTIRQTLRSVEDALRFLAAIAGDGSRIPGEVVIVEDGSTDGTFAAIRNLTNDRSEYRVIQTGSATNPACARNRGVACSTASLLFFLDGDDRFLPEHLAECLRTMEDDRVSFLKTGVSLAHPVHPDWAERIANSIVINLCVRRRCHEFIGGFPDYHLFLRHGSEFRHGIDVFCRIEDVYYNELLFTLFQGAKLARRTVEYCRRPGNALDRQYDRFCRPFAEHHLTVTTDEALRHQLARAVVARLVHDLKAKQVKQPAS
jgi:glycosyltransferase involved in cell wall biosynthesis